MHSNSSYPKECGQKCSGKLQVEPFWWIIYIVVIITFTDYIAIIVEDHTQPSDKDDSEERGLYAAIVKEINNYRNEALLLNSIHPIYYYMLLGLIVLCCLQYLITH